MAVTTPPDDDAWIEAELERELAEMGSVSGGESDREDEADHPFLTEAPAGAWQRERPAPDDAEAGGAPERNNPRLQELIAALSAWEADAAESIEEAVKEAQSLAQEVVVELRSSPGPAWDVDAQASACSTILAVLQHSAQLFLSAAERRAVADLAMEAMGLTSVEATASDAAPASPVAPSEHRPAPPEEPDVPAASLEADERIAEEPTAEPSPAARDAAAEERTAEEARAMAMRLRQLEEEQERAIEEARAARLRELEWEQEMALRAMQQEAEARRIEQARIREEVAMHSEELLLLEFYAAERMAERRERRQLLAEDRQSAHMREEERRALQNANRAREAEERAFMGREDAAATRRRRLEWELRETRWLAREDESSRLFNREMRRLEEAARQAREEEERRHAEQLAREALELQRMVREDELSDQRRQCEPVKPLRRRRPAAAACGAAPGGALGSASPADAPALLAGLLAASPATPSSSSRGWSGRHGSSGPRAGRGGDAEVAAAGGRDAAPIDVWASLLSAPTAAPAAAGPAPPPASAGGGSGGGHSERPEGGPADLRCSGALCAQLSEGVSRWKRKPPPLLSRPAAGVAEGSSSGDERGPDAGGCRRPSSGRGPRRPSAGTAAGLHLSSLDDFDGPGPDVARLEVKMEGLAALPDLSRAKGLRSLVFTGNRLTDLEPLRHCAGLRELLVNQNALPSLRGIAHLQHLVVLRAAMNELADVRDLARLPALRHVELSKNKLTSIQLAAPGLLKLELYRNRLTSTAFLEHLPSLTELNLGKNQLASVDARISDWNPLLVKVFLWRNSLTSLPELQLPLLSVLEVDDNQLRRLGPLGFLPSLERLSAKSNQIESLVLPFAASPLLHDLELAFNQLGPAEPPRAIPSYPRLRRLQLNDNPASAELMEAYRPWVLSLAPQLELLDNETVSEEERRRALATRAAASPHLAHYVREASAAGAYSMLGNTGAAAAAAEVAPAKVPRVQRGPRAQGLLGLAALLDGGDPGAELGEEACMPAPAASAPRAWGPGQCPEPAVAVPDLVDRQRRGLLAAWSAQATADAPGPARGCDMCALALWCEALASTRKAHLVTLAREERLGDAAAQWSPDGAGQGALLALRRRRSLWKALHDLCLAHLRSLSTWDASHGGVARSGAFESYGLERARHRAAAKLQARWRGVLDRARCRRLRLQERYDALTPPQRVRLARAQALWRGAAARQALRAQGVVLPRDRRRARQQQAATQLQAAVRGCRVRRKLRWAREMARITDEELLGDCPEIDVDMFLGGAAEVDVGNAFAELRLPDIPEAASIRHPASGSGWAAAPVAAAAPAGPRAAEGGAGGPRMAWSTPPSTAGAYPTGPGPAAGVPGVPEAATPLGSSRPGSSSGLPRRARSLSSSTPGSTADSSAVFETDGCRGPSKAEQVQEEWGFQDAATAKLYLAAQRHRMPKPPPMPGRATVSAAVGPTRSAGGGAHSANGRLRGVAHTSKSAGNIPDALGKKACLKAQDQIAEFRRQQEEAQRRERSSPQPPDSPSATMLEFRSGPSNLKLARSSRGLQQHLSSSPRARSPGGSSVRSLT